MNNFIDLCNKRQSCRDFVQKEIGREKLENCVEAGRLAPSACNSQPWSFYVAHSPEVRAKVAQAVQAYGINEFTSNAGGFIVVVEEHAVLMKRIRGFVDSQHYARQDLGCAVMSICFAAVDQGLGVCTLGLYDREILREALGIPEEKRIHLVIALGYPADETIRPKMRKTTEEIAKFL